MKNYIDQLFTLPPAEKRKMLRDPWRELFFGKGASADKHDIYVSYLVFKTNIVMCAIYALFLLLSFKINFDCFVCVGGADFIRDFSWSFGLGFSFIQTFIIFPLFYYIFRRNIDWKSYDFLWWRFRATKQVPTEKIHGVIRNFLLLMTLVQTAGIGSFGVFVANRLHLHQSEGYLFFLIIALPVAAVCIGCQWFFYAVVYLRSRDEFCKNKGEQ